MHSVLDAIIASNEQLGKRAEQFAQLLVEHDKTLDELLERIGKTVPEIRKELDARLVDAVPGLVSDAYAKYNEDLEARCRAALSESQTKLEAVRAEIVALASQQFTEAEKQIGVTAEQIESRILGALTGAAAERIEKLERGLVIEIQHAVNAALPKQEFAAAPGFIDSYRGQWREGMVAQRGDLFSWYGSTYLALEDTNDTPGRRNVGREGAKWAVIAARGAGGGGGGGGDSLPSQTGNAGKFLQTDGVNALWANVPGGTGAVDSVFGETGVVTQVDYLALNVSSTVAVTTAKIVWNATESTGELGFNASVNTLLGMDVHAQVYNQSGSAFTKGQVVKADGSSGTRLKASLALATSDANSAQTLGLCAQTISDNGSGVIITQGLLRGIDTNAYNAGDTLYLSATTPGALTNVRPTAPLHGVRIGYVVKKAGVADGIIFVDVQNGLELEELHDVAITAVQNNDIIAYNASTTVWRNRQLFDSTAPAGLAASATAGVSVTAARVDHIHARPTFDELTIASATFGDILYRDSVSWARLPAGASGNFLKTQGAGAAPTWAAVSSGGGGGTKTYSVFTPLSNQPPAVSFATLDTRNSVAVLDFDDGATSEVAVFLGVMPEAASVGSGLKVRIHWAATSATSGNVEWAAQFERLVTDIDADSFDTAVSVTTTTSATSGVPNITEISTTYIDSVTGGDGFRLKIYRDSADTTNDTMVGDAELIAVEVRSAS